MMPRYIWISDKQWVKILHKYVPNISWDIITLKKYSFFIWNSNLTGCPVVLFAKSGNSIAPPPIKMVYSQFCQGVELNSNISPGRD